MAKAKFTTGVQTPGESCPAVAETQRVLDLIVTRAGTWKSRIEDVQCTAIDARLTLMEVGKHQEQVSNRTVRHIADELSFVVDDIETLVAKLHTAAERTARCRPQ